MYEFVKNKYLYDVKILNFEFGLSSIFLMHRYQVFISRPDGTKRRLYMRSQQLPLCHMPIILGDWNDPILLPEEHGQVVLAPMETAKKRLRLTIRRT